MLRSGFFAVGLFVGLWGVSLLFVDQIVLRSQEQAQAEPPPPQQQRESGFRGMFASRQPQPPQPQFEAKPKQKVIDPPEWAAFTLMSIGSVAMLYSVALPRKTG